MPREQQQQLEERAEHVAGEVGKKWQEERRVVVGVNQNEDRPPERTIMVENSFQKLAKGQAIFLFMTKSKNENLVYWMLFLLNLKI